MSRIENLKGTRDFYPDQMRVRRWLEGRWREVSVGIYRMNDCLLVILDVERLMDMPAHERTFLLGSGLGNLQCDHGAIFAAHQKAMNRN